MPTASSPHLHTTRAPRREKGSLQKCSKAEMRLRQRSRIRELRDALVAAGFVALDKQANVLGLSRSTTWTILKGNHKGSGLSAAIINRMLAAPLLPQLVRAKIFEYVEEKMTGFYGDSEVRRRKFMSQLSVTDPDCLR
jgi:hypothetical protein